MSRDLEILLDIQYACREIQEFIAGLDYETFRRDRKTQSSVLYQLVIIGEAINRCSTDFVRSHPEIPYSAIRGMRNRIIHEYKEVDIKVLWEVVHVNIPELLSLFGRE